MLRKWLPIRSLKLAMLVVTVLALAIAIAIEHPTFDASLNWLLLTFMLIAGARFLAEPPPRKAFWAGFLVFAGLFVFFERSYLDQPSIYSRHGPTMVIAELIKRHEFTDEINLQSGHAEIIFITQPSPYINQGRSIYVRGRPDLTEAQAYAINSSLLKSQQAHERALPIVVIAIGMLGGFLSSTMFKPLSLA